MHLGAIADLTELENLGAGSNNAIIVKLQVGDGVLGRSLGAAHVDALGAGFVDVGVMNSHVIHRRCFVIVGFQQHPGKSHSADLDKINFEVRGAAAYRQARRIALRGREVIDQDAVGALAIGVGASSMASERAVAGPIGRGVFAGQPPVGAASEGKQVVVIEAPDVDLAATIGDGKRGLCGAIGKIAKANELVLGGGQTQHVELLPVYLWIGSLNVRAIQSIGRIGVGNGEYAEVASMRDSASQQAWKQPKHKDALNENQSEA